MIRRPLRSTLFPYTTLSRSTTERHAHLVLQFLARHQESVLCRTLNRIAERADAARDDRHLVNRVDTWQRKRHQRMTHLVIGDDLPLPGVEQPVFLFQTRDDPFDGVAEVAHRCGISASPRRHHPRFVAELS